jgi:beta-glucosidase-like glycosyl hydrolase/CubicO group peptidase (beta-lactamase class C family)
MKKLLIALLVPFCLHASAQDLYKKTPAALQWVDSVFNTLTPEQKIGQLMIIRAHSNLGADHIKQVTNLVQQYNVGGLCFFQGGPVRQANLTNYYQRIAKTPLMICIDGEWGLGMRLDSVINFPRQLMIGAIPDAALVYEFGRAVGEQCKRIGIHVNYAPVVDINNNPDNPVINDRSFGEDKYKVALYGVQYMKGMQDVGVMATAKHFPGHGDVAVDSHLDLPIINKTKEQLDSLELYPFREIIKAGVGSMMVAHLYIPSIDTTKNQATSLSYKNVTELLRNELKFKGITFTDALEMQGVSKFYPAGAASVQSLIAGNDMLCLPGDVPGSIAKIIAAINDGRLTWTDINARVKKVLLSKYHLGLNNVQPIQTKNLVADLNRSTINLKNRIAKQAVTLLSLANKQLLPLETSKKVLYIGIGSNKDNAFAKGVKKEFKAKTLFINYKDSGLAEVRKELTKSHNAVIIGLHNYSRRPANNFNLSKGVITLLNELQYNDTAIIFAFGNPYAIKNFSNAKNLVACYEDDEPAHKAAVQLLDGEFSAKGKLPVTVAENLKFGTGITANFYFPYAKPEEVGLSSSMESEIDSIANTAISKGAMPGAVVLVAKDGKVAFHKAYGTLSFDSKEPVSTETVYDLASVTKISATTMSVMKLYDEGKLKLDDELQQYIPWLVGTDKATIKVRDVLLHQAGLIPFIPFYKETIDSTGKPLPALYRNKSEEGFEIRVAEDLYLRNDWRDTIYQRIATSKLGEKDKYVYSDNDFIFLGKIVEAISGQPLDQYVRENFYLPLAMMSTTFKPREHMPINMIAPTEKEKHFRQQMMRGDVHDEGAALMGGVAGHAGLFSNAYDLAQIYQALLNGGELGEVDLFKKKTIKKFTDYQSTVSRRGYGFDKPEKDNATRKEAYPSKSVSVKTFGHTGFTGTCVWVDPEEHLVYIFLSNRVNPTRDNNKLGQLGVRPSIQEAIYKAIVKRHS